jgi:hypothetical protein
VGVSRMTSARFSRVGALLIGAAILSGCHGPSAIFGTSGHSPGSLGVSQKISTIRVCVGALNAIEGASRLAARTNKSAKSGIGISAIDVQLLVAGLRKHAAAHLDLPISRSLNRLITSLTNLQRALGGSTSELAAAAQALGTAAENVVTTCAAVGA